VHILIQVLVIGAPDNIGLKGYTTKAGDVQDALATYDCKSRLSMAQDG